jgi:hypothetical protein
LNPAALAEPRPAVMDKPTELPVWVNGTLPGVMAGKRPGPKLIVSF